MNDFFYITNNIFFHFNNLYFNQLYSEHTLQVQELS